VAFFSRIAAWSRNKNIKGKLMNTFKQEDARAQIGKRVRVRECLPERNDIPVGTVGKVIDVEQTGTSSAAVGTAFSPLDTGDGFYVVVEFYLPRSEPQPVAVEKDYYERCLEQI
jgi:hypothetical protein